MADLRWKHWATAALLLLLPECQSHRGAGSRKVPLTVFAASSLKEAFEDVERAFETHHPEVDVQLSLAGSQILRLQIEEGAKAHIFASANEQHLQHLQNQSLVVEATRIAANSLALIVPAGNPAKLETLRDLPKVQRIITGTDQVPIGQYTELLLERASAAYGETFASQIRARIVSQENNVRLLRTKVELGEADAAIVYHTDALASDRVDTIPIPDHLNVTAQYHVGVVRRGTDTGIREQFLSFLKSMAGRQLLDQRGFNTAP